MDFLQTASHWLNRLDPRLTAAAERRLKTIPFVQRQLDRQYDRLLHDLTDSIKPYRTGFPTYAQLPATGLERTEIVRQVESLATQEESRWRSGFASGAVYHGDPAHVDFVNHIYALTSQNNPLHADLWPSTVKFEAEIVAMAAHMLGATAPGQGQPLVRGDRDDVCGTVTSGGTESILLAMKTYRDWAREQRGVTRPELVVPVTAHAAFDKAAQYFGITLRRIPLDSRYQADVDAARGAITPQTIALVGSAPAFPHGIVDPIADLAALAQQHGIGCHVDACLGGFVLPWAEKLGYPVPPFDFRVPGVTSLSVDTHKYGYAAKGTSVILYRGPALRRYQYYTAADWPGGLYFSPTLAGSRPGALSAACWAAMLSLGEAGYLEATRAILTAAALIKQGIRHLPELEILGDPLWVIAFASPTLNIYQVMERLAVTLRHTQPGVAVRFLADLEASVRDVKAAPNARGSLAPVYGLAGSLPLRGVVNDLLARYVDLLYRVDSSPSQPTLTRPNVDTLAAMVDLEGGGGQVFQTPRDLFTDWGA